MSAWGMWSRIWDRWWSRRLDRISTGGMPGGQSADLGVQAADTIDNRVGGVVSGLSDFCVNLADMIAVRRHGGRQHCGVPEHRPLLGGELMVAWSDVLNWRADYIEAARQKAEDALRTARAQVAELEDHQRHIQSQGDSISAMRGALGSQQSCLDHGVNYLAEYMLACAEAVDGVRRVTAKVESALEISEEIGYPIHDDGSVDSFSRKYNHVPGRPLAHIQTAEDTVAEAKHTELKDCVADALRIADEVDAEFARRLRRLAMGTFARAEGRASISPGLPNDADESWSPSEVSAWWAALTDEERQACIERDPLKYGNLDGIDMASRDKANRLALYGREDADGNHVPGTGLLDQAQAKFDEAKRVYEKNMLNGALNGYEINDLASAYYRAERDLMDLQKIDEQLRTKQASDGTPLSLLALDTSGEQVKAAVAVGDVDHAQHVANFTPGMGTNVRESLANYVDVADRMRDNTEDQAGVELSDVAVVAWLNYDAPTDVTKTFDPSVASTEKAHEGADRLAGFLTGVRTWRNEQGGSLHLTSIGHSYGSTTTGLAMLKMGEGVVDNQIYLASPGSGAHSVGALGVDPSHVWVSAVPEGDAVQGMGPDWSDFARDPVELEGIQHLSGDATGAQGYVSVNPGSYDNHSSYFAPPKPGERNKVFDDVCKVLGGAK